MREDHDPRQNVRNTDPETSHQAAEETQETNRAHERTALQWFYDHDREEGWTQAEFNRQTPEDFCGSSYWRRLSQLRIDRWTVEVDRRMGDRGQPQIASRITEDGCKELGQAVLAGLPDPAPKAEPRGLDAVLTAANTIGYALEQENVDISLEAALAAAQRLEEQGLLRTPDQIP